MVGRAIILPPLYITSYADGSPLDLRAILDGGERT